MNDHKNIWAWVGVAVVVVGVVVWVAVAMVPKQQAPQQAAGPTPVMAPQGQLTPGFPKELILDNSAAITGSYSVNYSSSTNQYTANYDSSSTVTSLFNSYKTYLTGNGWTINGTLTTNPNADVIVASKGNDQLQAVIGLGAQKEGSRVILTYVIK